jgi:hypothetical protein
MRITLSLFCNYPYINKCYNTLNDIRTRGEYTGDIVFFYDQEFEDNSSTELDIIKNKYNCILKKFPIIDLSIPIKVSDKDTYLKYPTRARIFQYFKLNTFQTFFKQWDRVLYMDCGIRIYHNIQNILDLDCSNKLIAHQNAYPKFEDWDTLEFQFELRNEIDISNELKTNYNLNIRNYFISSLLYFDTSIIEEHTFSNLVDLMNKYPISMANDQGILNLYFICIKNKYQSMPINNNNYLLFDFWERNHNNCNNYVMLKYPQTEP